MDLTKNFRTLHFNSAPSLGIILENYDISVITYDTYILASLFSTSRMSVIGTSRPCRQPTPLLPHPRSRTTQFTNNLKINRVLCPPDLSSSPSKSALSPQPDSRPMTSVFLHLSQTPPQLHSLPCAGQTTDHLRHSQQLPWTPCPPPRPWNFPACPRWHCKSWDAAAHSTSCHPWASLLRPVPLSPMTTVMIITNTEHLLYLVALTSFKPHDNSTKWV